MTELNGVGFWIVGDSVVNSTSPVPNRAVIFFASEKGVGKLGRFFAVNRLFSCVSPIDLAAQNRLSCAEASADSALVVVFFLRALDLLPF